MATDEREDDVYKPVIGTAEIMKCLDPKAAGYTIAFYYGKMLETQNMSAIMEEATSALIADKKPFVWLQFVLDENAAKYTWCKYKAENVEQVKQILKTFACYCIDFPNNVVHDIGTTVEVDAHYTFTPVAKKRKIDAAEKSNDENENPEKE